jgi:ABC-2 type transport system permease protein
MYGARLSAVLLRFLPVTIIAILLPAPYKLYPPISIYSFIVFLISLLISSLLVTSISILIHIIAIFTLDEKGIMAFIMVIGDLFSGCTVPLTFFPKLLKKIAYILPFRYIADTPFRIYSGNVGIDLAIKYIFIQIIWIILLYIIGNLLMNNVLKKATVQGG